MSCPIEPRDLIRVARFVDEAPAGFRTRTEVYNLFSRHRSRTDLDVLADLLVGTGLYTVAKVRAMWSDGRPRQCKHIEVWTTTERAGRAKP